MAFIIHRSSYCGGRSTQLQRNGPSRLHWRVTLQLYIDGYTAKRKRESRWASRARVYERPFPLVCASKCKMDTARHRERFIAGLSPSFFLFSFHFFFFFLLHRGGSTLLDDSFNFLGRAHLALSLSLSLPFRRCSLFFCLCSSFRPRWPTAFFFFGFRVETGETGTERRKSRRDKKSSARSR